MAIKFNYQQTMQQAKNLEQMASDLSGKTKSKITGVKENLNAAWTGDSGKAFIKFMGECESDLDAKAKYLRGVADYLKKSAKKIKEAEEAARASASGIS
ncbi:WXG100 family type VII secretion target [Butyrivibrio sp. AE3006]|jgi:WXG100 family type VII secretion target|uniref:WXG100 family type VII secretion target n=1 Tax=Butyrivibrio sp. AE3006 TaxID=1280673 RepID=UPI0003F60688|nr:WXG100 family type VII secretion target [Butyrivibrio sp. AE3006]